MHTEYHKHRRGTLHGVIMCEGCVSLEMQRSHDDEYVLKKIYNLMTLPSED